MNLNMESNHVHVFLLVIHIDIITFSYFSIMNDEDCVAAIIIIIHLRNSIYCLNLLTTLNLYTCVCM